MNHLHGFLPHRSGGGLEIQLPRHRNYENEKVPARAAGHQRLEHLFDRAADPLRHRDAVDRIVPMMLITVMRIGDSGSIQNPHHIGFFLLCHCEPPVQKKSGGSRSEPPHLL